MTASTKYPVVIDQQNSGPILKWLTEEEFWQLGRERFYRALREVNEQARVAEEERKQVQKMNQQTKILHAAMSEREREKQIAENSWQLDMHDIILDRGVR